MTQMNFPPASILKGVRTISVEVNAPDAPTGVAKACKNVIETALQSGRSKIRIFSTTVSAADAHLRCIIRAGVTHRHRDNTPIGYAYVVHFDVLATVPSHGQDELFGIWNGMMVGHVDASALSHIVPGVVRDMTLDLVDKISSS
jgi:hypothetical protein